jgi:hypothetical protein
MTTVVAARGRSGALQPPSNRGAVFGAAGLLLALLLLPSSHHGAAAAAVSMQCTLGTEKSGSGTTANWPTYHFMNNVTRNASSGALLLEPLNDANAIVEYKGIYHAMMQEGGGNWSHGVSNDSE